MLSGQADECAHACVQVRAEGVATSKGGGGGGVEVGHKERSEEGPEVTRREGKCCRSLT